MAIVFAAGLIFWQVKARKTGPVELTAEDMQLIAEDQPDQMRARLLPSLDMVAVSQAPSPESNPDSPSPVVTMVGTATTIES